jgi:hypothetical protein
MWVRKEEKHCKIQHGKYIRSKDRKLVSEEGTILWQMTGDLKADTDSEIIASKKVQQIQQMQTASTA